jgi:glutathione S-transferase
MLPVMPNLKLTYFDMDGGRGEVARLALTLGGIPFEDHRISFQEFGQTKDSFLFGRVPILHVDGKPVAECNGINRYVGKLAGLYPDDPWQAALCDETMGAVEDAAEKVISTFGTKDEAVLKEKRKELADGPLRFYAERLGARLAERGKYFADNRLTVADLKVFLWVRHLRSGNLDHVPVDLLDRYAPNLVEHFEMVKNHEGVKAYYDARK